MSPTITEAYVGQAIVKGNLFSKSMLAVPNCNWTGYECDLLVIEPNLRLIDVEIKISRADLKQDGKKDKWYVSRPWSRRHTAQTPRSWPDKAWKHYYVLPLAIWDNSLIDAINATSGVITLDVVKGWPKFKVIRPAKPNRDAKPISPADAIDIARLANIRMWRELVKESK